jgi:AsmA protein
MKKWLILGAAIVGIIVVVLLALPFVIPVAAYKDRIVDAVKSATGRDFAINGAVSLSLLPSVALEVNDVSFGNAPGASDKTMARLAKLELKVGTFALIRGQISVDALVLDDPQIALEVDKQGRPNWQFAAPAAPSQATAPPAASGAAPAAKPPAAPPSSTAAAPPPAGGGAGFLEEVHLGDIRLVNGTVTYFDARSGKKQQLAKINAKLSLPGLDSPMQLSGSADWNSKTVELALDLSQPRQFLDGTKSPVSLNLSAPTVKFAFKGDIASANQLSLVGTTTLDIPSMRDLAVWTGATLPPTSGGLGPLKIDGKLDLAGSKVAFSGAQIALDAIKAKGDLLVDATGAKPYIKAGLDVDKLDLNPYLPPAPAKGAAAPVPGPAAGASPPTPAKPAAGAASGWSDDPIDMSGLNAANADLALTVGGIVLHKITIGQSALAIQLKDGKLAADLSKMELYGGSGTAKVDLDGAAAPPALPAPFNLAKVQAQPLLSDAMDFDRLSGSANGDVALTSHGKSQRQLVGALGGKGAVQFLDGAIKGINLSAIFRNPVGSLLDANSQKSEQTDFSQLTGTFTIANGIVENKDLLLKSPLFDVNGTGTVDLPQQIVNYHIEPPAAIPVAVQVDGPWSDIKYRPQPNAALLKQPGKALEGLQTLIPGAAKGGATGGSAPGSATGSAPAAASSGGLLKGLLGGAKQ